MLEVTARSGLRRVLLGEGPRDHYRRIMVAALMLAIGFLGLLAHQLWSHRRDADEAALRLEERQVRQLADHANRTMDVVDYLLTDIALDFRVESRRRVETAVPWLRDTLADRLPFTPAVRTIRVFDPDGRPVATTGEAMAASAEILRRYRDRELTTLISPPRQVGPGQRWVVPVSRAVFDPDSGFLGFVEIEVDPAYFQEYYRKTASGAVDIAMLYDAQGQVLAAWSAPGMAQDNPIGLSVTEIGSRLGLTGEDLLTPEIRIGATSRCVHAAMRLGGRPLLVAVISTREQSLLGGGLGVWAVLALLVAVGGVLAVYLIIVAGLGRLVHVAISGEEQAKADLDQLRGIIEQSPYSVVVSRISDGALLLLNRRARAVLGVESDRPVDRTSHDFYVYPEDRRRLLRRVNELGQVHDLELELKNAQGDRMWVVISSSRIEFDGAPALCTIGSDITGRKRIEDELRQREQRLQRAQRLSRTGSLEWDVRTGAASWSDGLYEILAVAAEDVAPSYEAFVRHVDPEDRWRLFSVVQEALIQRRPFKIELRLVPGGGGLKQVAIQADVRSDESGRPRSILAAVIDITEERAAAAALRESEAHFRGLVESSPDPILLLRHETIAFANTAALRFFRAASAADLAGQPILRFLRGGLPGGTSSRVETEFRCLDDSVLEGELLLTPIGAAGEGVSLAVIHDLSQRKRSQAELVQASKLATLGEIAAGMAHELSQPINIVRLTAEGALLKLARGQATADYQQSQLELVASQAERMGRIIEHMRIFSRRDSGALETLDPAEPVTAALELLHSQLKSDGIEVVTRIANDRGWVYAHRVQLEQVVLNLLANAHDALRGQPDRAEAGWHPVIEISVARDPTQMASVITVADNGPGIPPERRERVFEPFFTTKEVGEGTGLGLSVSYGIVTALGGNISVIPRQQGVAFQIMLPTTAPPATSLPGADPDAEVPADAESLDYHILIADDEPLAARAMADYLVDRGYRVTTAGDGIDAYDKFLVDPADVVVADVRMPRLDGLELVRRLRVSISDLPAVIVSGHLGLLDELDRDFPPATTIVLKKPVSPVELAAAIDRLVTMV
jgi:PAS domain S-box-containing protein